MTTKDDAGRKAVDFLAERIHKHTTLNSEQAAKIAALVGRTAEHKQRERGRDR